MTSDQIMDEIEVIATEALLYNKQDPVLSARLIHICLVLDDLRHQLFPGQEGHLNFKSNLNQN